MTIQDTVFVLSVNILLEVWFSNFHPYVRRFPSHGVVFVFTNFAFSRRWDGTCLFRRDSKRSKYVMALMFVVCSKSIYIVFCCLSSRRFGRCEMMTDTATMTRRTRRRQVTNVWVCFSTSSHFLKLFFLFSSPSCKALALLNPACALLGLLCLPC